MQSQGSVTRRPRAYSRILFAGHPVQAQFSAFPVSQRMPLESNPVPRDRRHALLDSAWPFSTVINPPMGSSKDNPKSWMLQKVITDFPCQGRHTSCCKNEKRNGFSFLKWRAMPSSRTGIQRPLRRCSGAPSTGTRANHAAPRTATRRLAQRVQRTRRGPAGGGRCRSP